MGVLNNLISSVFGDPNAPIEAGRIQAESARLGREEVARQFDVTQQQLAPYRQAGVGALNQQQALLGLNGQDAQQSAFAAFNESPGQAFLRKRQERALLRNQGAIGGLGGGNVRTELQKQATGFAQQDYQNQLSRLSGLSGAGQTATTSLGQLGAQSSGQISNLLQAGGQAQAAGLLGASEIRANRGSRLWGAGIGALAGGSGLLGKNVTAGGGALLGLM